MMDDHYVGQDGQVDGRQFLAGGAAGDEDGVIAGGHEALPLGPQGSGGQAADGKGQDQDDEGHDGGC